MKRLTQIAVGIFLVWSLMLHFQEKAFNEVDQREKAAIKKSHDDYVERYSDRLYYDYSDNGEGEKYWDENKAYTHEDLKFENAIIDAVESIYY